MSVKAVAMAAGEHDPAGPPLRPLPQPGQGRFGQFGEGLAGFGAQAPQQGPGREDYAT